MLQENKIISLVPTYLPKFVLVNDCRSDVSPLNDCDSEIVFGM